MVRISKTSKLDGIQSWSLEAIATCPGSIADNGGLVDACKGCYATTGFYRMSAVKAPREFNREDWKRPEWVSEMVQALDNARFFRWFDSGDVYAIGLAEKILEVMKSTPWVKHWMPTRMYKFDKFKAILDQMNCLPNVSIRYSSDSVHGEFITGFHGSTIIPTVDHPIKGAHVCMAYENDGKCNGCRACWNRDIETIAYVAHGRKMAKVISIRPV